MGILVPFSVRSSGVRAAASALAGVVSFALLGVFINPLPAQAETAPPAAEVQVTSRPDSLSASLTARSTGHRVEDLSQRTESSQVFANPDSTWTLESYTAPKFSRKSDGSWSDARTDLVFGTDSVVGSVAGAQLALSDGETPADGVADLVKISLDRKAQIIRVEGAFWYSVSSKIQTKDCRKTKTYTLVFRDVPHGTYSLRQDAKPDQTLTLAEAPF